MATKKVISYKRELVALSYNRETNEVVYKPEFNITIACAQGCGYGLPKALGYNNKKQTYTKWYDEQFTEVQVFIVASSLWVCFPNTEITKLWNRWYVLLGTTKYDDVLLSAAQHALRVRNYSLTSFLKDAKVFLDRGVASKIRNLSKTK